MKLFWLLLILWQLAVNEAKYVSHERVLRQTEAKCLSPSAEDGLCISIRQCKSLLQMIIDDGKDVRTIQFLRSSKCGGDRKDPKVCCPDVLQQ